MGASGPGKSVDRMLRRPMPSHPYAVPPAPGGFGVWQIRRHPAAPLGYVLARSEGGVSVYHCYAHGRDAADGRPWLRRAATLNSAVAWMIQHESELSALSRRLGPEPDPWPA